MAGGKLSIPELSTVNSLFLIPCNMFMLQDIKNTKSNFPTHVTTGRNKALLCSTFEAIKDIIAMDLRQKSAISNSSSIDSKRGSFMYSYCFVANNLSKHRLTV